MFIYIPVWIDLKRDKWEMVLGAQFIYIPVWIDLKHLLIALMAMVYLYLHSSMDRFEEPELRVFYQTFLIYIPVWIDLKGSISQSLYYTFFKFTFQYG